MPIYIYCCGECATEWTTNHGMSETEDPCANCDSTNIYRVPSSISNLSKKISSKKIVGDLTEEFIEKSRENLQKQKKDLKNKR